MSTKKETNKIKDVLKYSVSKTESIAVKTSKSKTAPLLIFWIAFVIVSVIIKIIMNDDIFDVQYITIVAGAATFAYMGMEYVDSFIKNKQLPSGYGKIENIERYKALVYIWCIISILLCVAYFVFKLKALPFNEAVGVSGILSVEYIAGNKANRIAVTMDGLTKAAAQKAKEAEIENSME